jgi:hypothetical protein
VLLSLNSEESGLVGLDTWVVKWPDRGPTFDDLFKNHESDFYETGFVFNASEEETSKFDEGDSLFKFMKDS